MIEFASELVKLAARGQYRSVGEVNCRWGQLLRQNPEITENISHSVRSGRLVPIRKLGRVYGGVVTRANAFFIVEELTEDEIPRELAITRAQLKRVTVIKDGLGTLCRVEKEFLNEVVKGPESLVSPTEVTTSQSRLFNVTPSKVELKRQRATGALSYIRRGETVEYRISEDSLKGGIPAERSNIKNRKPYWYSLSVPDVEGPRIVIPEHIDRRYIATLLPAFSRRVVIDKLYSIEPLPGLEEYLLMCLNSLLTAYQLEIRGRTQLGQGVLEAKLPDWGGILVLNPGSLSADQKAELLKTFEPLKKASFTDSFDTIGEYERVNFDSLYLQRVGTRKSMEIRLKVERELRAIAAERRERKESVSQARIERQRVTSGAATIDAYAIKIAGVIGEFPDLRALVPASALGTSVVVNGPIEGVLAIGEDLFHKNKVVDGHKPVVNTTDSLSAKFVKAVLQRDQNLSIVEIPKRQILEQVMPKWILACQQWRLRLRQVFEDTVKGIKDDRLRQAILERVYQFCHAEEE